MSRCLCAAIPLLLAACGAPTLPPLSDVRYDFKGDIVGKTTLAEFKAAHPDESRYVSKPLGPEFPPGFAVIECEFDPEHREPTFVGLPSRVTYVFKKDLLVGIVIVPTRRQDIMIGEASVDPFVALKEKLGEPRMVREQGRPRTLFTADWESQHSCASYYVPKQVVGFFDKSHPNAREETYARTD